MPMKMGWRWYGEGNDPVTLSDIKQIPGVTSIVWALHNKMPGEIWEIDEIQKVADQIHAYGFDMDVVESVNVHDDIKIGLPTRDKYIENYKQCIRNLSKFGVKVICYNFMPVFDWTRTDLAHVLPDGSDCLSFEEEKVRAVDPERGIELPGWGTNQTPAELQALLHSYRGSGEEELCDNCRYFLRAVLPVAEECGVTFREAQLLFGSGEQSVQLKLGRLEIPAGRLKGLAAAILAPGDGGKTLLPDSAGMELRFKTCLAPAARELERFLKNAAIAYQPEELRQDA